jgi:hypothetical protein
MNPSIQRLNKIKIENKNWNFLRLLNYNLLADVKDDPSKPKLAYPNLLTLD